MIARSFSKLVPPATSEENNTTPPAGSQTSVSPAITDQKMNGTYSGINFRIDLHFELGTAP